MRASVGCWLEEFFVGGELRIVREYRGTVEVRKGCSHEKGLGLEVASRSDAAHRQHVTRNGQFAKRSLVLLPYG